MRLVGNHGDPWTYCDQFPRVILGTILLLDHLPCSDRVAVVYAGDVDGEHSLEILFREVKHSLDLCDPGVRDPVLRIDGQPFSPVL